MINRLRTRLDAGRQDGFTLIELLIVIVILGVLAGIVVFAVGGITDRGANSACEADLKSVETAMEAYYAKESAYPSNPDSLVPGYLRSLPTATFDNGGYTVTAAAGGVVTAANPDGDGCPA